MAFIRFTVMVLLILGHVSISLAHGRKTFKQMQEENAAVEILKQALSANAGTLVGDIELVRPSAYVSLDASLFDMSVNVPRRDNARSNVIYSWQTIQIWNAKFQLLENGVQTERKCEYRIRMETPTKNVYTWHESQEQVGLPEGTVELLGCGLDSVYLHANPQLLNQLK